jgi:phosphoribosyl-AMP cyclohydrolase
MKDLEIEEGTDFSPRFDERGLLPVITTDHETGIVLMLAWMNEAALYKTIETGEVHYWSRSRAALWHKGATSGNVQIVQEIKTDCDQDTLWISARQTGSGACHTGRRTCFYRTLDPATGALVKRDP